MVLSAEIYPTQGTAQGMHLSPAEREHRISLGLCLYCGCAGHCLAVCLVKGQCSPIERSLLASATSLTPSPSSCSRTRLAVTLCYGETVVSCSALVDSRAKGDFNDSSFASANNISLRETSDMHVVFALDGSILSMIYQTTLLVSLTTFGNHQETISFFVFNSPMTPLVLGYP